MGKPNPKPDRDRLKFSKVIFESLNKDEQANLMAAVFEERIGSPSPVLGDQFAYGYRAALRKLAMQMLEEGGSISQAFDKVINDDPS